MKPFSATLIRLAHAVARRALHLVCVILLAPQPHRDMFMSCIAQERSERPPALGIFSGSSDIGNVTRPGSSEYEAGDERYIVRGAGTNMWGPSDECQFLSRELRGDFILTARASLEGAGTELHRKLGWMIRNSLQPDAPYVDATVHGDGLTSLQYRRRPGAATEEVKSGVTSPNVIQLARTGNNYTMSVAKFGEPLQTVELKGLDLGDPVQVGLFICSHNASVTEQGTFREVRITRPAPEGLVPYRDYLGARLETVEVATGERRLLLETTDPLQAPNWSLDGKYLIYNCRGELFRFDLETRQSIAIDTGFADQNNNDHAISCDGTMLAISHHEVEPKPGDGTDNVGGATQRTESLIYTLPVTGGVPRLVTSLGPSYLHGWSPDGKTLTYTGQRDNDFNIYTIPTQGGDELRLTNTPGLDDGSEYSPDGAFIFFNSVRSGRMQLWRMNADGSDPLQWTDDAFNNWFPHISPDGKWIVFLSFSSETKADDHPFYKQVYLRLMPAAGGAAKIIAYVYGGQGSLNVPSWSPDSRHVAFVSNTALPLEGVTAPLDSKLRIGP